MLTKREKKEFLARAAIFVADRLTQLKATKYDYVEITRLTGVTSGRLSELTRRHMLGEKTLKMLIGGGVVKATEIAALAKTEAEMKYARTMSIVEDRDLAGLILECKEQGIDVDAALRELLNKENP